VCTVEEKELPYVSIHHLQYLYRVFRYVSLHYVAFRSHKDIGTEVVGTVDSYVTYDYMHQKYRRQERESVMSCFAGSGKQHTREKGWNVMELVWLWFVLFAATEFWVALRWCLFTLASAAAALVLSLGLLCGGCCCCCC
jgi:hypothetical protein